MATILALGFTGQTVYAILLCILRNSDCSVTRLLPNNLVRGLRSSPNFRKCAKLTRSPFYRFMIMILTWDFLACLNFIFWPVLYFASPIMGAYSKLFMTHIAVIYWPIEQLCASNVNWLTAILSVDRLIAITYPLTLPAEFVGQNSGVIMSIVLFVTLLGSIPYSLPFKVDVVTPKLMCFDYEINTTINYEKHFGTNWPTFFPPIRIHKYKSVNVKALKTNAITLINTGENFYKYGYHKNHTLILVNGAEFLGKGRSFNSFDNLCLLQTTLNNLTVICTFLTLPKGFKYITTRHYITWNSMYDKVFVVLMYLIPVIIFIFCNIYMLCKLTLFQRKVIPTNIVDNQFLSPVFAISNDLLRISYENESHIINSKTNIATSKFKMMEKELDNIEFNQFRHDSIQKTFPKMKNQKPTTLVPSVKKRDFFHKKTKKIHKPNRNITKLIMFLNVEFLLFNVPYFLFIYIFNHAYVEVGPSFIITYQVYMNTLKYSGHAMRVFVNLFMDKNIKKTITIIINQKKWREK
ncbi:unnamed protein product [Gordionus sp. m RMFG-2023]